MNASNDGVANNSNVVGDSNIAVDNNDVDTNNNQQPIDLTENTDDENTEAKDNFLVKVFKAISKFLKSIFNAIKS